MGWVSKGKLTKVVCDRCGVEGMAYKSGKYLSARTKCLLWTHLEGWAISPKNDIAYCAECRPPPEAKVDPLDPDFRPTRWDKILKG